MAKSFLEAMEEQMPLYGKSPLTGRPKARPASDPSEGDPDEEELLLADLLKKEQEKGIAAGMGGLVGSASGGSPAMGNSSTETPMSNKDLYRVTSGEEELDSVDFADLVGAEAAKGMQAQMGGRAGEGSPSPSRAMGNSSTGPGDGDEAYRLTSGEEPESQADMVAEMGPKFDKSSLLDPTIGARRAGVPEEQLLALFKATHGGKFNPDSKTDRLKRGVIESMLMEDGSLRGLSPAKFAMRVYARQ